jgi:acyl-CoA dehydrogenase
MIAAVALDRFASSIQKERLLPQLCAGELRLALAVDEHAKHDPRAIATTATPCDNGFKLNGQKLFVPDGGIADWLIVLARTEAPAPENPFTLLCVDATAAGVSRSAIRMLDGRTAARVRFDQVEVSSETVLAAPSHAEPIIRRLLGVGRAGLAAEMLGAAEELFRMTLEYLKVRRQFGRTIGSFQALQHRASRLFVELQLARSAVLYALQLLDEDSAEAELACVAAKAKMGEVANLCCAEAIQMHGGIGVTDEHDVGLYLKRIRVAQETMGDYAFLANEFAVLNGY